MSHPAIRRPRALERLRRDGLLAGDQLGRLVIAEPDAWAGRIPSAMPAVIEALDGVVGDRS